MSSDDRAAVTRGRPRIRSDRAILDAALAAFASDGFEAMSVRRLNRDLGLSHGTVQQRFGSKAELFIAAVDSGLGRFVADIVAELARRTIPGDDDVRTVWELVRAFLVVSSRTPMLARLVSLEGMDASPRLDHIFDHFIEPALRLIEPSLDRLAESGAFRRLPARAVFFLITGAGGAYSMRALAARFDGEDGPLDDIAHAELTADVVIAALRAVASTPWRRW